MAKSPVSLLVVLDSGLTYGLQKLLLLMLASLLPVLGVIGLVVRGCKPEPPKFPLARGATRV